MKKLKLYVIVFLMIILSGLAIQKYSGYLYMQPVGIINKATVKDEQQELAITLLNDSKETIQLTVDYYENSALDPHYTKDDQVLLSHHSNVWSVVSLKRDGYVFIVIASFMAVVVFIAGKKGVVSLCGVVMNLLFLLLLLYVNKQYPAYTILPLMVIYSILAVVLSMGILYGFKKMDIRKILATLISVFVAFAITTFVMKLTKDRGLRYEEMQFLTRPYRSVFLASLLIGAIGAALDNVVIIISTLDQITMNTPDIEPKKIIQSGLNVAFDTSASMVTVLFYAYLSGAVPTFLFYLANDWTFRNTFSMQFSLELLRALCGGITLLLTVPAAIVFFMIFRKKQQGGEAE